MTDLVRIASDLLSARINPFGAELHALQDAQGRDLLWDGDPAFWTGRAPILFPIVGGLNNDRYRWRGRDYSLPKHGFARRSLFTVIEAGAASAVFRLEASDETRAAYPFDFRLDVRFAIDGASLTLSGEVSNLGDGPMPASFGFHPALRWPLPGAGARGDCRLIFDQEEPAPIRRLDPAGLIDPAARPTPVEGRDLPLRDDLFTDDAIIFDRLESRSLDYGTPERRLRVSWDNCPQLGVWTKPGAGYLCIEPWHGFADPQGFAGALDEKPGVFVLEPGQARRMAMTITAK